ncbi:PI-PLC domain-containing protein [Aureivirga marina]|uniref:hypothetical protein n=1 Tax=Aureivirga marina TaxID=1182451 RepID=UPI0018C910C2|nr:hypothetical protein [Aureivirga marina]
MFFRRFIVKLEEKLFSPGRVLFQNLNSYTKDFKQLISKINKDKLQEVEVITHGVGSWRFYPMGINKDEIVYGNGFEFQKTPAKNINDLIDEVLKKNPTISFEIDVQYPPENHEIRKKFPLNYGCVIHDIPNWEKIKVTSKATQYLQRNSIKNVLNHFVNCKYYQKSKLHIEIKVTEECYGNQTVNCELICRDLAKDLLEFIEKYKRASNENWIWITSFSPKALKIFRKNLPENLRNSIEYSLILGYQGGFIKSKLAQLKGFVPAFDEKIKLEILEMDWLNCIWFSIQGIPNFKEEFIILNQKRKERNPNIPNLEFNFSTYQFRKEKLFLMLLKHGKYPFNFRSFLIDIDDK